MNKLSCIKDNRKANWLCDFDFDDVLNAADSNHTSLLIVYQWFIMLKYD